MFYILHDHMVQKKYSLLKTKDFSNNNFGINNGAYHFYGGNQIKSALKKYPKKSMGIKVSDKKRSKWVFYKISL